MQEVIGSIPFTSTNLIGELLRIQELEGFVRRICENKILRDKFQGFDPIV